MLVRSGIFILTAPPRRRTKNLRCIIKAGIKIIALQERPFSQHFGI